jgi:hypothetical protein
LTQQSKEEIGDSGRNMMKKRREGKEGECRHRRHRDQQVHQVTGMGDLSPYKNRIVKRITKKEAHERETFGVTGGLPQHRIALKD